MFRKDHDMAEAQLHRNGAAGLDADVLTGRGIDASVGRHGQPDRIEAHMWFNIAALSGGGEAIRLRRELAQEMSPDEIATAQRLAREWLKNNVPTNSDLAA